MLFTHALRMLLTHALRTLLTHALRTLLTHVLCMLLTHALRMLFTHALRMLLTHALRMLLTHALRMLLTHALRMLLTHALRMLLTHALRMLLTHANLAFNGHVFKGAAKFVNVLCSYRKYLYEIYKILHPTKISRYTVICNVLYLPSTSQHTYTPESYLKLLYMTRFGLRICSSAYK